MPITSDLQSQHFALQIQFITRRGMLARSPMEWPVYSSINCAVGWVSNTYDIFLMCLFVPVHKLTPCVAYGTKQNMGATALTAQMLRWCFEVIASQKPIPGFFNYFLGRRSHFPLSSGFIETCCSSFSPILFFVVVVKSSWPMHTGPLPALLCDCWYCACKGISVCDWYVRGKNKVNRHDRFRILVAGNSKLVENEFKIDFAARLVIYVIEQLFACFMKLVLLTLGVHRLCRASSVCRLLSHMSPKYFRPASFLVLKLEF